MNSPDSEKVSRAAIWSFILGLIGFLLIPMAFILGIGALLIIAIIACISSAIALSVIGPKTVSRAAIWSFILGLLGPICWAALGFLDDAISLPFVFGLVLIGISLITGPLGIAYAIFFLFKMKKHRVSHVGARFAIAGLIFGIANSSIIPLFFIPSDVLFNDVPVRSMDSRARNDMRTIATALESYYADQNCYPQSTSDSSRNLYAAFGKKSKMASQPTFGLFSTGYGSLTTPVNYFADNGTSMSAIPADPFAPVKGAPLCYYLSPDKEGWILWSAGPDRRYDLTSINIGNVYHPANRDMMPGPELLRSTYDPTNGTKSTGDVWRVKG